MGIRKALKKVDQIIREEVDEPRKREQDQLAKRRAEKQQGKR